MVGFWSFTSLQHLRSYQDQDGHRVAHSCRLHSAAPVGAQAAKIMMQYPTQWHYTNTEQTSSCSILLRLSIRLGCENYVSLWLDLTGNRTRDLTNVRHELSGELCEPTVP